MSGNTVLPNAVDVGTLDPITQMASTSPIRAVQIQELTGSATFPPSGVGSLFASVTQENNVNATGTTAYRFTPSAAFIAALLPGDRFTARFFGTTANNSHAKSVLIDSGVGAGAQGSVVNGVAFWQVTLELFYTGPNSMSYSAFFSTGTSGGSATTNVLAYYGSTTEPFSALSFDFVIQGTSSSDVLTSGAFIDFARSQTVLD